MFCSHKYQKVSPCFQSSCWEGCWRVLTTRGQPGAGLFDSSQRTSDSWWRGAGAALTLGLPIQGVSWPSTTAVSVGRLLGVVPALPVTPHLTPCRLAPALWPLGFSQYLEQSRLPPAMGSLHIRSLCLECCPPFFTYLFLLLKHLCSLGKPALIAQKRQTLPFRPLITLLVWLFAWLHVWLLLVTLVTQPWGQRAGVLPWKALSPPWIDAHPHPNS